MISPKKIKSSPVLQTQHSSSLISESEKIDKKESFFNYKNYIMLGIFAILSLIVYYLYRKLKDSEKKLDSIESIIDKKINTLDQNIQIQQQLMTQKLNMFEAMTAQQKLFINTKIDELSSTVQNHINFIRSQTPMSIPPHPQNLQQNSLKKQSATMSNMSNMSNNNDDFDITDLLIQQPTIVLEVNSFKQNQHKSSVIIEDDEQRESSEIESDLDKELVNELNELNELKELENSEDKVEKIENKDQENEEKEQKE